MTNAADGKALNSMAHPDPLLDAARDILAWIDRVAGEVSPQAPQIYRLRRAVEASEVPPTDISEGALEDVPFYGVFVSESDEPSSPGWYWGATGEDDPRPIEVRYYRGDAFYNPGLYAATIFGGLSFTMLRHFKWFGPVQMVRRGSRAFPKSKAEPI